VKVREPKRVRLLDRQASAAGQIFAPAKSAFMPSLAISRRRRAYMDVFTASCRASDRTQPSLALSFAGAMTASS